MSRLLLITGISQEREYVPRVDSEGNFESIGPILTNLIFNHGEFVLPISMEQATLIEEFMALEEEEPTKEGGHVNGAAPAEEQPEERPYGSAEIFGEESSSALGDYAGPPHEVMDVDEDEEDGVPQY